MKIKLFTITVSLLLISCENSSSGWSQMDDFIESDSSSYSLFMEGCLVDNSFRDYCNCAYNKIEKYGFEYYLNNIESIAQDCSYYLY